MTGMRMFWSVSVLFSVVTSLVPCLPTGEMLLNSRQRFDILISCLLGTLCLCAVPCTNGSMLLGLCGLLHDIIRMVLKFAILFLVVDVGLGCLGLGWRLGRSFFLVLLVGWLCLGFWDVG